MYLRTVTAALLALALTGTTLHAQRPNSSHNDSFNGAEFKKTSERKEESRMKRPKMKDPASQLAHADKLRADGKISSAMKQYRALVHTWHSSSEAIKAQTAYAELLLQQGKLNKSFDEFQYLIKYFSGNLNYDKILDYQFKIANAVMTRKRMKFFGLKGYEDPERALPLFEKIVENAPNWKRTPQAQFQIGLINEQIKNYEEAIEAFEIVQSKYSTSPFAATASFRRAFCLHQQALKAKRDKDLSKKALAAVSGFIRDYSDDPNLQQAEELRTEIREHLAKMYYDIALFYDKAGKTEAAIIAYSDFLKKFPSSEKAVTADKRMDDLKKIKEKK